VFLKISVEKIICMDPCVLYDTNREVNMPASSCSKDSNRDVSVPGFFMIPIEEFFEIYKKVISIQGS
jgi:hypothetical protein